MTRTRFSIVAVLALTLAGSGALIAAPAATQGNIVEVAVGAGNFETLVAAVQAAGLVDTLSGEGPFIE